MLPADKDGDELDGLKRKKGNLGVGWHGKFSWTEPMNGLRQPLEENHGFADPRAATSLVQVATSSAHL